MAEQYVIVVLKDGRHIRAVNTGGRLVESVGGNPIPQEQVKEVRPLLLG